MNEYKEHIDGLRAVAVLAVLLYHLNACLTPGGFTGVDVFFVISGYLIVLGIVTRLEKGSFSFVDFFHRRVKRIIPAYIGMICTTLLVGATVFPWEKLMLLGEASCFSALYSVNAYYVMFTNGYFDASAETSPLLNLWSLSVEQQFYILIPFLVVGVYALRARRLVGWILFLFFVLSLVGAQAILNHTITGSGKVGELLLTPKSCFYMLHTRLWELLAGALIAVCPNVYARIKDKGWLAVVGLILIACPYIFYTKSTPFPGIAAIPSVLGAALVIACGGSGVASRLLTLPPVVYIGKISYSLYLYHWPTFLFYKYCLTGAPSATDYLVMLLISFACGCLSYHFVETPIRRSPLVQPRISLPATVCSCLLVSVCGFTIAMTYGLRDYIHVQANRITPDPFWRSHPTHDVELASDFPKRLGTQELRLVKPVVTHFEHFIKRDKSPLYHMGDAEAKPSFLLIGDSHAMHLTPGMDHWAKTHHVSGVYFRKTIIPLWDMASNKETHDNWDEQGAVELMAWLEKHTQIKTVVIACWWDRRMTKRFKNWNGETLEDPDLQFSQEYFHKTIEQIHNMGINVVIMQPLPIVPGYVNVCERLRAETILGRDFPLPVLTWQQYLEQRQPKLSFLQQASRGMAHLVSISEPLFKNSILQHQDEDGRWTYYDSNHLTPKTAIKAVMGADEELSRIMVDSPKR